MADKCFCHFSGFKVKDADARKMIAESKIDSFTDAEMELVSGGDNLTAKYNKCDTRRCCTCTVRIETIFMLR